MSLSAHDLRGISAGVIRARIIEKAKAYPLLELIEKQLSEAADKGEYKTTFNSTFNEDITLYLTKVLRFTIEVKDNEYSTVMW